MALIGEVVERDLKRLRAAQEQYQGFFSKTANALESFMKTEKPFQSFMRRIVYASGGFKVINQAFIGFRTAGKVYDKTVGSIVNKNSLLGKSFQTLSKLKIPNFAERLGGGIKGIGRFAESMARNPMPLTQRVAASGSFIKERMGSGLKKRGESMADFVETKIAPVVKFVKNFDWIGKTKSLFIGTFKLIMLIAQKSFNFIIITTLGIVAILAFVKIFWNTVTSFKDGFIEPFEGYFAIVKEEMMNIWAGIQTIFSFFTGDASFTDMVFALLDISFSFLRVMFELAKRLTIGLIKGLIRIITDSVSGIINWFGNLKLGTQLKYIGAVALGILLWLFSVPVIVPAIILGALFMFGKWFLSRFGDKIPFMANGGISQGGMTVVGERGPELVSLPKGSRVHSNSASKKMVGGTTIVNNITINARDTSDGEMRRIANKISTMVNNKINRTTSSRTMG